MKNSFLGEYSINYSILLFCYSTNLCFRENPPSNCQPHPFTNLAFKRILLYDGLTDYINLSVHNFHNK